MIVPDSPTLSAIIWAIVLITMLYLARQPAHKAMHSLLETFYRGLRLASRSLMSTEERMRTRNREVLLESGKEAAERQIEREFYRIDAVVKRDLADYPALHKKMQDGIERIEDDYGGCTEDTELPSIQGWEKAVDAVAKIPTKGNSMVSDVLSDINNTFSTSYRDALEEYRQSCNDRISVMSKMAPVWRDLSRTLDKVNRNITDLHKRAGEISGLMQRYEDIQAGTDKAIRMLSSSSVTQFFVSFFVLVIAIGGAVINFNLIAYPMQEMVGGSSYLMGFKTANIAALVIILVEISMGLFLMELLRVTRLFPMIGSIDDKMRKRMIWICFGILLTLACVESALAFMRDVMAADKQAFNESIRRSLDGTAAVTTVASRNIPMIAQMVIGFILPFALVFVAIPLESFIHSSRTVMGIIAVWLIRGLAFLLRFMGTIFKQLGTFFEHLYDLVIFVPLWLEKLVHDRSLRQKDKKIGITP
jgi:hypothetical protein